MKLEDTVCTPRRSAPLPESAASQEEVRAAYLMLTSQQLLRLERYAKWKTRGLERMGGSSFSADELLADALIRTLQGERKWYRERVSFFGFFQGVLRSISGQWYEHLKSRSADFEVQNRRIVGIEGESDPLDSVADGARSADQTLHAREMLGRVHERFADDAAASSILRCWEEGMTPAEIREELGFTVTEFETAHRRLVRGMEALCRREEHNG